jgi:hypothetical protein
MIPSPDSARTTNFTSLMVPASAICEESHNLGVT